MDHWWRGQSDDAWSLLPRVRRSQRHDRYETNIAIRFYNLAPTRHPNCPDVTDLPGWLFFMQHYGLPTRLLDWTMSPLIAAYFAVIETKFHDRPGALWALQPTLMNEAEGLAPTILSSGSKSVAPLYRQVFHEIGRDFDQIIAVLSPERDIRMLVQQGVHTIHGSGRAIDDHEKRHRFLVKFTIPATSKPKIRTQLASMGIRTSTLFPDLEHLSQELAGYTFLPQQQT